MATSFILACTQRQESALSNRLNLDNHRLRHAFSIASCANLAIGLDGGRGWLHSEYSFSQVSRMDPRRGCVSSTASDAGILTQSGMLQATTRFRRNNSSSWFRDRSRCHTDEPMQPKVGMNLLLVNIMCSYGDVNGQKSFITTSLLIVCSSTLAI